MKAWSILWRICGIIVLLIFMLSGFLSNRNEQTITTIYIPDIPEIPPVTLNDTSYWGKNSGSVTSEDGRFTFSAEEFAKATASMYGKTDKNVLYWTNVDGSNVVSAKGTDMHQHFVSGYLSNYKPFDTDHLGIPLQTLAMRKQYMLDEKQYGGQMDVWQYSIEAYSNTRGDCEDHSIILCDWLNSLGYETRVACGTYDTEGHAWVVLYMDGKEYILEATQKSNLSGNGNYPLAVLQPRYHPDFMFDGEYFYIPKTKGEHSHSKDRWKVSSKYVRTVTNG